MKLLRKPTYEDTFAVHQNLEKHAVNLAPPVEFADHFAAKFGVERGRLTGHNRRIFCPPHVGTYLSTFFPVTTAQWHMFAHAVGMKVLKQVAEHPASKFEGREPLLCYVSQSIAYMLATTTSDVLYRDLVLWTQNVVRFDVTMGTSTLHDVSAVWAAAMCANPLTPTGQVEVMLEKFPDMVNATVVRNDVCEPVRIDVGARAVERFPETLWYHALFTLGMTGLASRDECPEHLSDIVQVMS